MSVERLKNMKRQVLAALNMIRHVERELEREIGEQNRPLIEQTASYDADTYAEEATVLKTAEKVIAELNEQTGKNFDPMADNTLYLIRNLLKRGYDEDHMIMVVAFMVEEWQDRQGMQLYLRPQTLFGDNFESYLQFAVGHMNKSRLWKIIAENNVGEG